MKKTHVQVSVLRNGILSLMSSLEVSDGALYLAVATGDPVEASGAHNRVALIIEQQEPQQGEHSKTPTPSVNTPAVNASLYYRRT